MGVEVYFPQRPSIENVIEIEIQILRQLKIERRITVAEPKVLAIESIVKSGKRQGFR